MVDLKEAGSCSPSPGRSPCCETERAQVLKHKPHVLVSWTERALRQSQRVAEELPGLRLLAAPREHERQAARREQRALVLCAEQTGLLDEGLAVDLHGLDVISLL